MRLVWVLLIVLAGVTSAWLFTRFEGTPPSIRGRTQQVAVGAEHVHEFTVSDEGMGIERIRAWVESGESVQELMTETYAGSLARGAALAIPRRVEVTIRPAELGLADGSATLRIEAFDFSWSQNRVEAAVPLLIDTRPPRMSVQTGLVYVRRGGAELAVYGLSEDVERHGVELGEDFFPGFPHPAAPERYVALWALPPDARSGDTPALVAEDRAGNTTRVPLSISVIERTFPETVVELPEAFLAQKVPEILGGEHPDLLASYLKLNGELRRENAAEIRRICEASSEERLWSGPFLQLPGSELASRFAEQRTYRYGGRAVDRQVHLGFDLASTARAPTPAANDGVVVFAGDLGIYGSSVVIDHGLGLFSLYGHLSEIAVERGQPVARGEEIGKTGTTGLAGGDHLHYGMMLAGVFVDPQEWFDGRWIEEHVEAKLAIAPPEQADGAAP